MTRSVPRAPGTIGLMSIVFIGDGIVVFTCTGNGTIVDEKVGTAVASILTTAVVVILGVGWLGAAGKFCTTPRKCQISPLWSCVHTMWISFPWATAAAV